MVKCNHSFANFRGENCHFIGFDSAFFFSVCAWQCSSELHNLMAHFFLFVHWCTFATVKKSNVIYRLHEHMSWVEYEMEMKSNQKEMKKIKRNINDWTNYFSAISFLFEKKKTFFLNFKLNDLKRYKKKGGTPHKAKKTKKKKNITHKMKKWNQMKWMELNIFDSKSTHIFVEIKMVFMFDFHWFFLRNDFLFPFHVRCFFFCCFYFLARIFVI